MVYYLLICRSLTYAQRAAKALEHAGITAIVTKVPQHISSDGCGYCVKVSSKYFSNALVVLQNAGLYPLKIYVLYADGNYGEVNL
jgi:rhodanese-related sulfurtransferase